MSSTCDTTSSDFFRSVTGLTLTETWRGASILVDHGKTALHRFIAARMKFPAAGSAGEMDLISRMDELVSYWREEFSAGFDPGSVEDDNPDRHDDADRTVIAWLAAGEIPPLHEAVLEISWPYLLRSCTEFADQHLPRAEHVFEQEELASFKVSQWMMATQTFQGREWIPRAEMYSAFENWSRVTEGRPAMAARDFYSALTDLGCQPAKRRGIWGFKPSRH